MPAGFAGAAAGAAGAFAAPALGALTTTGVSVAIGVPSPEEAEIVMVVTTGSGLGSYQITCQPSSFEIEVEATIEEAEDRVLRLLINVLFNLNFLICLSFLSLSCDDYLVRCFVSQLYKPHPFLASVLDRYLHLPVSMMLSDV